jgi:hypothetical protein
MFKKTAILGIAMGTAFVLASAGTASADAFAMSSVIRNYCCDDWTDKDHPTTPIPNPGGGAFGFKGGQIIQDATVNRTVDQNLLGAVPFDVAFPQSIVGTTFGVAGFPHPNPLFDVLTLDVEIQNEAATLSAGGGPGAMEFCPFDVGPAASACPNPALAVSGPSGTFFHGRIAITPDPAGSQFGGAMSWLGGGLNGVINSRNAPGAAATEFTAAHFAAPFSVIGKGTTSLGLMGFGPIPGDGTVYSTSMHYTMATPPTPIRIDVGDGRASGHIWTTGMVTVSQTAGNNVPPFQAVTLTGSDTRETTGPDAGSGGLTLVSGNLYADFDAPRSQTRGTVIEMQLPEPTLGLSVAAGAICLVLAGVSRKRG